LEEKGEVKPTRHIGLNRAWAKIVKKPEAYGRSRDRIKVGVADHEEED